ncbi:DASH complex subunit Ask1-domain-containing protein [Mycena capillaripes]|nr:DASH complex subunit Ask1-domain-containing protein [Mycena capillaripes]
MESKPIPPNPPRWQPSQDPASIVVPGLDTTAPLLDQIEQMEQLITIKLQNIDENFSKIHNVLTNRILPAVKRYAVATKPVKEAANFWVSFYEKAAEIRIPAYDDYSTVNEVPSERDDLVSEAESSSRTEERTMRPEDHSIASTEPSFMPGQAAFASTPATARVGHTMDTFTSHHSDDPSWSASLESPLTRLDREVQNFSRENSAASSRLPSLRFDEPPEDEHTIVRPRTDKGKGKDSAQPLLQSVLRHTLYSTSDVSLSALSPAKGKLKTPVPRGLNPYLPPETEPANWSGLVDLRHTPLGTPQRKKNRNAEDDDDSFDGLPPGMSPPVLMSPAKPPRSSAELQLLRGKTPAKVAASRIKNDLVRDIQRQNSAKARRTHGYALSGGESSMSTVSSPPSLSRYNRADTDESVVDESLESVMQRVALNPPSWTPTASTPGLRLRPKPTAFPRADPVLAPNYMPPPAQYQDPIDVEFSPPATPHQYDGGDGGDFDSDSDSLDEVNNTAHPSAAFLMAQAASGSGGSFDEDDSFQSQDSLDQADVDLGALGEGVVDVHPFARGGYAYTGDDSFDDETFDTGVPEETVFGRPPAQRAQARMSEHGELLMYGDEASVPDTMQYGMAASSPTPHYSTNSRG